MDSCSRSGRGSKNQELLDPIHDGRGEAVQAIFLNVASPLLLTREIHEGIYKSHLESQALGYKIL